MQHIVVYSARPHPVRNDGPWVTNGVGRNGTYRICCLELVWKAGYLTGLGVCATALVSDKVDVYCVIFWVQVPAVRRNYVHQNVSSVFSV